MKKLVNYFKLNYKYKFELNDVRAILTLINIALIIALKINITWLVVLIALLGLYKDIVIDKRLNGIIIHLSNIVLNIYILLLI